jgi:dTDP-4-amino-4,6-dideoxygalactose transaminase
VVERLGARPVFVDISARDYCMDPDALAAAIGSRTRAVIPVHLFGQAADMASITEAAGSVPIIEDCAQSWGADFEGRVTGSLGLLGAFSFFPSKNLGGFGDGGLVTTDSDELLRLLRELRVHGQSGPYEHPRVGGNFRLHALQAAVLRVKLPHTVQWIEGRRRNAERYRILFAEAGLYGVVELPEACRPRPHLQPVRGAGAGRTSSRPPRSGHRMLGYYRCRCTCSRASPTSAPPGPSGCRAGEPRGPGPAGLPRADGGGAGRGRRVIADFYRAG